MTTAARKRGRRYPREQAQEDRSEGQLKDRFAEIGWPCGRPGRDLGEDLHVAIYDDGASTGLVFHVQLKSTADSAPLRKKRSPVLAYELEVKDLLHWEVSVPLVVLVVWDVAKQTGWWRPIREIIKELDGRNKGWRKKSKKSTVVVSVPLANTTDDDGLTRLRWAVATHNLPLVPKQMPMKFSLIFRGTDGMAGAQALEKALDMGETLTLEGSSVPEIEMPEWHRRVYGPAYPTRPTKIELKPTPPSKTKAVRIEAVSSEDTAAFPYIELRVKTQGRKRSVFTNEHQMLPLVFTFEGDESSGTFGFEQVGRGDTVYQARDAIAFMLAAGTPGAEIRIIDIERGALLFRQKVPPGSTNYDVAERRRWMDLLDKLCFIQRRIARYGTLSLDAFSENPAEEAHMVKSLFATLRDSRRKTTKSFSFEVAPDQGAFDAAAEGDVHIEIRGVRAKLLNLDIPLGNVRATVLDREKFLSALQAAYNEANTIGKPAAVDMKNLRVMEEYVDLLRGEEPWAIVSDAFDRLAGSLGPSEGYFTRGDAGVAGGTGAMVLDSLVAEHKAIEIAPGVYHLAHFPRSEHEDLIALWLQTDKQGVLSHDSALFLNDLSDILPRRHHVSVPPGWAPVAGELGDGVVVHRGEVDRSDLRWLGPVPYTAPLRTLRDCIASHLAPDLVEQAVFEGLRRGMFTEAELPEGTRRGAA